MSTSSQTAILMSMAMSTSSQTASTSRSPSPATPSSDSPSSDSGLGRSDPVTIHTDTDLSSWYQALPTENTDIKTMSTGSWDMDMNMDTMDMDRNVMEMDTVKYEGKYEDDPMLRLDELLQEHAFDDSCAGTLDPSIFLSSLPISTSISNSSSESPLSSTSSTTSTSSSPPQPSQSLSSPPVDFKVPKVTAESHVPNPSSNPTPLPNVPKMSQTTSATQLTSVTKLTKPIPPPASLPRKADPSTFKQKVVRPPKESCYNLPIMFPSIPPGGCKSRVETQVRVTVDLADSHMPSSSSSLLDSHTYSESNMYKEHTEQNEYNRVGSWKWLKLPRGTATKKRTRKQGKIEADPEDTLTLSATITCASAPHNRVLCCSSCQTREAKRVAKKIASRVRPARSDSDSPPSHPSSSHTPSSSHPSEDTTSIIQFNCLDIIDFSSGSVILPLRITCYCRHHREKVGFTVHMTMYDMHGRVVGAGSTRPIMITDDHKTSHANANASLVGLNGLNGNPTITCPPSSFPPPVMGGMDFEWTQVGSSVPVSAPSPETKAPSKRKSMDPSASPGAGKKRAKPYDSSAKPNYRAGTSREGSVASSVDSSAAAMSPVETRSGTPAQTAFGIDAPVPSILPPLQYSSAESESSPDHLSTPLDTPLDVSMFDGGQDELATLSALTSPQLSIPQPTHAHPMPYLFFPSAVQQQHQIVSLTPTIHRLIPSSGPTHGGIEVTILGVNFHPNVRLECVFGGTRAVMTQRWSDNALVCVLPPRVEAGVVRVWFDGFEEAGEEDGMGKMTSLFTYSDESDRALMELALQVVGLKMTGKIEDAKNVAMRIVGNAGDGSDGSNGGSSSMMQHMSTTTRDLRPLMLMRAGSNNDFESLIVNFLSILDTPLDDSAAPDSISTADAISHGSELGGQTLLHLAAFLGFTSLVRWLVGRGVDLDKRDANGFTALHFAVFARAKECVEVLVIAGADREIVDGAGKTAEEIDVAGIFAELGVEEEHETLSESEEDKESEDDEKESEEEAQWGDGEEDAHENVRRRKETRVLGRRATTTRRTAMVRRKSYEAAPPPHTDAPHPLPVGLEKQVPVDVVNEKTASFIEMMIQRTLAQLPAPPQLPLPNLPGLPQLPHLPYLPHLPNFPGMPAVPWAALPQLPMVFPVYVPMMQMPGWPLFRGNTAAADKDKHGDGDGGGEEEAALGMGAGAIKAAQEWRGTWEKWVAQAVAAARLQQQADVPPPMYTPRAAEDEVTGQAGAAASSQGGVDVGAEETREGGEAAEVTQAASGDTRVSSRRLGYVPAPAVTDQEVNAYTYQRRPQQKKQDRMLILFWIPILFLSFIWAWYNGAIFVLQTIRDVLPINTVLNT